MERRLWNPSLPQTLLIASFLLYANVITALLFRNGPRGLFGAMFLSFFRSPDAVGLSETLGNVLAAVFVIGSVAAGYLITNEKKVGWKLGVFIAALPIVARVVLLVAGYPSRVGLFDFDLIGVMFDAALLVALLHPQSKEHQRIWFS